MQPTTQWHSLHEKKKKVAHVAYITSESGLISIVLFIHLGGIHTCSQSCLLVIGLDCGLYVLECLLCSLEHTLELNERQQIHIMDLSRYNIERIKVITLR